jgi:hypothetical protein
MAKPEDDAARRKVRLEVLAKIAGLPPVRPAGQNMTMADALAELDMRKAKEAEFRAKHADELAAEAAEEEALRAKLAALPMHERRQVLDAAGLKHVSAAPPPPSHIRGSYAPAKPKVPDVSKPDWRFWSKIKAVKVWQAVALSLGIDPDGMNHNPNAWMAGPGGDPIFESRSFPSDATKIEYDKRLRLLKPEIANTDCFYLFRIVQGSRANCEIYLRDFVKWALAIDLGVMPPELVAMAQNQHKPVSIDTSLNPPTNSTEIVLEREYYSIMDAAKTANMTIDDLLHFGAHNKLPIYALLPELPLLKYDTDAFPEDDLPFGNLMTTSGPVRMETMDVATLEGGSEPECTVFYKVDFATGKECRYLVRKHVPGLPMDNIGKGRVTVRRENLRIMARDIEAILRNPSDTVSTPSNGAKATSELIDDKSNCESSSTSADGDLAALFDPVTVAALEKMFPASNKWSNWAERAARNKLQKAREERGLFNPYKASVWFLTQGVEGWDTARCNRVLANNLPARSIDRKHLLTGELPD